MSLLLMCGTNLGQVEVHLVTTKVSIKGLAIRIVKAVALLLRPRLHHARTAQRMIMRRATSNLGNETYRRGKHNIRAE